MNQTFIMLKPDTIERGLIGNIISMIEAKNYRITQIKSLTLSNDIINNLYKHHQDKPYFGHIVNYMTRGQVIGLIVEGEDVVNGIRDLIGATNCVEASKDTIRGAFCDQSYENLIHASDSVSAAEYEISTFFNND